MLGYRGESGHFGKLGEDLRGWSLHSECLVAFGFQIWMPLNWGLIRRGFGAWRMEAASCLKGSDPGHLAAQLS